MYYKKIYKLTIFSWFIMEDNEKNYQNLAKKYAKDINKFLSDDIFPRVLDAIAKEKDGIADFENICDQLGIVGEQKIVLTATAFGMNPDYYKIDDKLGMGTSGSRPQTTDQLW